MNVATVRALLVPGAWMGGWIWEPTVRRLAERGIDAETVTLRGLERDQPPSAIASVRLDDHVEQVLDHIAAADPRPVVLVSHSYSGMPTTLAADRSGTRVCGLIHLGAFLPINGRSLLDDWGETADARDQERADIARADGLWLPPERRMLDFEPDLTVGDRDDLAGRFTPHPGRTVTDPARLSAPVSAQPTTYVALSARGGESEAWADAPRVAQAASGWRRRHMHGGHWAMVSRPEATADLLAEEIRFHSGERG